MVSVHHQHRPLQRSTHLSPTDEFWLAPLMTSSTDTNDDDESNSIDVGCTDRDVGCCSSTAVDEEGDSDDCTATTCSSLSIPPAHDQLLVEDQSPSYTKLTGHDHTKEGQRSRPAPAVVCYSSDEEENDDDEVDNEDASSSSSSPVKKRQGGGGGVGSSWLLGSLARLTHDKSSSSSSSSSKLEEQERSDSVPPGLIRIPSGSSLESEDSESSSDEEEEEDDNQSLSTSTHSSSSSTSSSTSKRRRANVSFSESVLITSIPHSSTLSPTQRRAMYSTSYEVRLNKVRNKKEYKYDGYNWRNCCEEWEMNVDMVTGELVHPVHDL